MSLMRCPPGEPLGRHCTASTGGRIRAAHAVSLLAASTGLQGVAARNMPSSLAHLTPCDVSILAAGAAYSGAEGWLSYGIYAVGRLAPAGGPSERRPNILVRIRHAPAAAFLTDGLPHLAPCALAAAALPGWQHGIPSPAPCLTKQCDVCPADLFCRMGTLTRTPPTSSACCSSSAALRWWAQGWGRLVCDVDLAAGAPCPVPLSSSGPSPAIRLSSVQCCKLQLLCDLPPPTGCRRSRARAGHSRRSSAHQPALGSHRGSAGGGRCVRLYGWAGRPAVAALRRGRCAGPAGRAGRAGALGGSGGAAPAPRCARCAAPAGDHSPGRTAGEQGGARLYCREQPMDMHLALHRSCRHLSAKAPLRRLSVSTSAVC